MFKKQFRQKSQVQLKSSEKKKFGADMKKYFPPISDVDLSQLFSNKEDVVKSRIITHSEESVEVYYFDKVPMFFDIVDADVRVPTVFCLWKFPSLTPVLTTNNFVFEKLKKGADLFIPGVITEGLAYNSRAFEKDDIISTNLIENKTCVAVGQALMSQSVIDTTKSGGKLLKIHHIVGDFLYKTHPAAEFKDLGPPDWVHNINEMEGSNEVEEAENMTGAEYLQEHAIDSNEVIVDVNEEESGGMQELGEEVQEMTETEKMDQLLGNAFLKAIKLSNKSLFPILPATFYASHILTNLPEGQSLNIKKTSWKKFSSFLQEMSNLSIIGLEEIKKNEFRIVSANTSHPKLKEFVVEEVKKVDVKLDSTGQPVIQQIHTVNAAVLTFFEKFGCKKKDELTRNDVRNYLNEYIKTENLQHKSQRDHVTLDPVLYGIIKREEVSRGELLAGMIEKMGLEHKISNLPNGTLVQKGKMPYIEFEVVTRSGNKKVTLINNLESYGVDVNNFSKDLQHAAAASTTVSQNVPGKKGSQVQVQGNQIHVAVKILHEKFKIHEKHMKGLEKAVKKK